MDESWFPCRWCGDTTAGVDSYVVCADCVRDFELRVSADTSAYDDTAQAPIAPEVEARLRKLLDW
jgi:hypothetical protein